LATVGLNIKFLDHENDYSLLLSPLKVTFTVQYYTSSWSLVSSRG
jgi:hypothetical protein